MMKRPGCSLIISTYNWPQALRLCLDSGLRQTVPPNEIIIADDGSGEETRKLIQSYQSSSAIPIRHVWQADEGYQLARIRNKAFAASNTEYLIQIDGDLILHPRFVEDHLFFCAPGTFISGARAMIDEGLTKKILQDFDTSAITIASRHVGKKFNALRSRPLAYLNYLMQRSKRNVHYVLGCNMAFWKKDLLTVNGYNEGFTGWGKEDNDLAVRLINSGTQLRFVKFGAIVYHLHHKTTARPTLAENEAMFKKSMTAKITYVEKGLSQHQHSFVKI